MGKVRRRPDVRRLAAAVSLYVLSLMRLAVVFVWFQKRRKMRRLVASSMIYNMKRERRVWMKDRGGGRQSWWETEVPNFNDDEWIKHFRMTKKTFDELVQLLENELMPANYLVREPIPTRKRVAISVYYLATGMKLSKMVKYFGVHPGSAQRHLHRFCEAMKIHYTKFIDIPNAEESKKIIEAFEEISGLPQIIGVLGAHHVHAFTPKEAKKIYNNSAGWGSFVLQGVVDHQYRFRDVFSEIGGGTDLNSIFQKSNLLLNQQLPDCPTTLQCTEVPLVIAAGNDYPLLPWLMTPHAGKDLSPEQEAFNFALEKLQSFSKQAFNRLLARWQLLHKKVPVRVQRIPSVITVCCMLHNLCEVTKAPILDEWYLPPEIEQPVGEICEDFSEEAMAIRDALCEQLATSRDAENSVQSSGFT